MSLLKQIGKSAAALMLAWAATASAEVVVVVSAKSSLGELNDYQVANLFLGKTSRLPNGDRAIPVDQPEGARARDEFYLKLANKSPAQVKAHWSKILFAGRGQPPREVSGDKALRAIAENPHYIGYLDRGAIDTSVKVVMTLP